jgi:hypothetical protein
MTGKTNEGAKAVTDHKKTARVATFWPSTQESAKEIRELWSIYEQRAVSNMRKVVVTPVHEESEEVEVAD